MGREENKICSKEQTRVRTHGRTDERRIDVKCADRKMKERTKSVNVLQKKSLMGR